MPTGWRRARKPDQAEGRMWGRRALPESPQTGPLCKGLLAESICCRNAKGGSAMYNGASLHISVVYKSIEKAREQPPRNFMAGWYNVGVE